MSEKTLKTRIIHKHDTEAHWNLAENFIPKQGELIVYDIDDTHTYERFKIGDGKTLVSALPFADTTYEEATSTAAGLMSATDKEKLDNINVDNLVTLDEDQSISGDKTFIGGVDFTNATVTGLPELPIEVEELPTENIDDSKIYILNEKGVEVYMHDGTQYMSLSALLAQMGGTAYYYIVDELPTAGQISDPDTGIMYCYIFNDIPYIYVDLGEGASWTTVSAYMGGSIPDKGVTENIANETEMGLYVYYYEELKGFYLYSDNQWKKINNDAIVDATDSNGVLKENVIYRVTKGNFYTSPGGIMSEDTMKCNVVSELPSVGNPAGIFDASNNLQKFEVYYVTSENKAYGYVDESFATEENPVGWYSIEVIGSLLELPYKGIIFDISQASNYYLYLLIEYAYYAYKNGFSTPLGIDTSKDYSWTGKNIFNARTNFLDIVWFGDPDAIIRPDVKFYPNSVSFMKTGIDMGNVSFSSKVTFSDEVNFTGATITGLPEPDLSNLVTLDTEQTISGKKTFSGEVDFTDATVAGLPEHIVDIAELPTENIDTNIIYRTPSCVYYYGYQIESDLTSSDTWMKCNPVDGLPEIGNPAAVLNTETGSVIGLESYYNIQDGTNSGYVDDTLAGVFGITKGWYSVEQLFAVAGRTYNGIVSELPNEINTEAYYLLVQHTLWNYKEGKWIALNNYNIYIDSNKASQTCAQEQWNRVTLSPETVVLVIPSAACLGFKSMDQNPGAYTQYDFAHILVAGSLDAEFDHLIGINARLLQRVTEDIEAPTISIGIVNLPASDTLAIKNEENSFSKLNTFNGDAVFNSNVDFTNANVTGLPASGLTQEEVQELIDTAINGALGGNY